MSVNLVARRGRERQRYDNNCRLVAGCIPYRLKEGENQSCNSVDGLEVLMISSPNRDDLVFPKGGWEDDETVHDAACREALEEAGVKGNIIKAPLGHWVFRSKSRENSCCPVGVGACKVYMYALEVTEELESWPEQANHGRRWISVMEAYKLCRYEWMREALDSLVKLLSGSKGANCAMEMPEPQSLCMILAAAAEGAIALC